MIRVASGTSTSTGTSGCGASASRRPVSSATGSSTCSRTCRITTASHAGRSAAVRKAWISGSTRWSPDPKRTGSMVGSIAITRPAPGIGQHPAEVASTGPDLDHGAPAERPVVHPLPGQLGRVRHEGRGEGLRVLVSAAVGRQGLVEDPVRQVTAYRAQDEIERPARHGQSLVPGVHQQAAVHRQARDPVHQQPPVRPAERARPAGVGATRAVPRSRRTLSERKPSA